MSKCTLMGARAAHGTRAHAKCWIKKSELFIILQKLGFVFPLSPAAMSTVCVIPPRAIARRRTFEPSLLALQESKTRLAAAYGSVKYFRKRISKVGFPTWVSKVGFEKEEAEMPTHKRSDHVSNTKTCYQGTHIHRKS